MLVSCLAYSLTIKMEVTRSVETSTDFHWPAWCYIQEDRTPQTHHCKNLKAYKLITELMELERLSVCLEQQNNTIFLADQWHADSEPSKESTNYHSKHYVSFLHTV
jgi:hypothetical protein